jgi:hypothetical protein
MDRIQNGLTARGVLVNYEQINGALLEALSEIAETQLNVGDCIELPTGATLQMTYKPTCSGMCCSCGRAVSRCICEL